MLVAPQNFREAEFLVPAAFFVQAGFAVATASTERQCRGRFGYLLTADFLIEEVEAAAFDALFMVGGSGALIFADNEAAKALAQAFLEKGAAVGAICAAPRNLLAWGMLTGKRCTGFDDHGDFAALCENAGAIYTGESVTTDGHICTGSGPGAAEAMANAFVDLVKQGPYRGA